jgi:hypothetical protein
MTLCRATEGPSQTTILGAVAVVVAGGAAVAAAGRQGELPSAGNLQAGASEAAGAAKGGSKLLCIYVVRFLCNACALLCMACRTSDWMPLLPIACKVCAAITTWKLSVCRCGQQGCQQGRVCSREGTIVCGRGAGGGQAVRF